jgi:polyphosphate glucokinase
MPKKTSSDEKQEPVKGPRTLAIDIGGSGLKAVVLDADGKVINDRIRIPTPHKATPQKVLAAVQDLAKQQGDFDRISAGFPGVVKDGVVYTAPNLGSGWNGFDLAKGLEKKLKRPARVANDADVQGLGDVSGNGLELVITLGTGFGSVLFSNGTRIHMELAHHPFRKGKTYEDELGRRALDKKGRKKWNRLLAEAIEDLRRTFNFDRLYIGGGNAKFITLKLPSDIKIVSNEAGLLGGIALWKEAPASPAAPAAAAATIAEDQPQPEPRAKRQKKSAMLGKATTPSVDEGTDELTP